MGKRQNNKTKYRTINDGYCIFLQYLHIWKLFYFIPIKTWKKIWRPYYDKNTGRMYDILGYDTYICRYNTCIDDFIDKWVYIDDYFKWAKIEQDKLVKKVHAQNAEIEEKKKEIKYF